MTPSTTTPNAPSAAGTEPGRTAQLQVEIVGGLLTISIGVQTLAHAIEAGPSGREWVVKITDPDRFAVELRNELLAEQEDGTTVIHEAFDKAAAAAIEDGAEGVHLAGEEGYDD